MMRKPDVNEKRLIGEWVLENDGSVKGDSTCDRIRWLTDSFFELVVVDGDNWSALYRNPDNGDYWELTYPQSEMHGGGPPALECISKNDAHQRYSFEDNES